MKGKNLFSAEQIEQAVEDSVTRFLQNLVLTAYLAQHRELAPQLIEQARALTMSSIELWLPSGVDVTPFAVAADRFCDALLAQIAEAGDA